MLFRKRERAIRRILIVEDEPLVAFDNEHLLREAGYHVVATVDSAEEAAETMEREDVHLVLTDITLRGSGDGTHVARVAREKSIAVLFVSGHCPLDARDLAIGCLAKPYTDKVLLAALEALEARLSGRKVRRMPQGLDLYQLG